MLRFALRKGGRLLLSLLGAVLLAAALAALSQPGAQAGAFGFLAAWGARLDAMLHLDFGASAITGERAAAELAARLPLTLGLVLEGLALALVLGVPVGFLFGAGPVRRAAAPLMQIVAAAPIFIAALALAYAAVNVLHWPVPINGLAGTVTSAFPADANATKILLAPAIAIGLAGAAAIQLAVRRGAAEAARQPYRTGLRRLGLGAGEIERAYAVPEIFAGLCASLGEVVLALLSAAAVVEWVFNCPGAADLFVKSLALQDWTVAALVLLVFAGLVLAADFAGQVASRALADAGEAP